MAERGMTPDKLHALRIKLRIELWKCFPKASAYSIWHAVEAMMRLMIRESYDLWHMEHEAGCACWDCVLALHCEVLQHAALLRVAHETAEEFD
jgi:hypothetical protein